MPATETAPPGRDRRTLGRSTSPTRHPELLSGLLWPSAWLAVVMVLLGAWRVGISTDEPVHVLRSANL